MLLFDIIKSDLEISTHYMYSMYVLLYDYGGYGGVEILSIDYDSQSLPFFYIEPASSTIT